MTREFESHLRPFERAGARWLLGIGAALLWLHFAVLDRTAIDDDAYFAAALDHASLWQFLRERYLTWSGRLPMDGLAALLMHHLWLWRVANVAMVALLCASVARLGFGDALPRATGLACAFAILLLMPPPVLREAAWWVTGSLNYLWPVALGTWAMVALFERRPRSAAHWFALGCAAGFAAYCEQMALAMLAIGVPRWWQLWRNGRAGPGDAWMLAALVVNAAVNFGAPGAQHRFSMETVRWFPDYDLLATIDKLHLGLDLIATTMARHSNLLVPLMLGATMALVRRAPVAPGVRNGLFAGMAGLAVLLLVRRVTALSASDGASVMDAVSLAMTLFGVGCLAIGAGVVLAHARGAAWFAWAMAAGSGTIAAVAFSPTVFASGTRTRFVCLVVMTVVACRLVASVRAQFGDRVFRRTMAVAGVVAAVRLAELLT